MRTPVLSERQVFVTVVFDAYGKDRTVPARGDPQETFVFVHRFQILHGVVDGDPEKGVDVGGLHKGQGFAFHQSGRHDTFRFQRQGFLREKDVQRFATRLDARIEYGDGVLQFVQYLFVQIVFGKHGRQLRFERGEFAIDELDAFLLFTHSVLVMLVEVFHRLLLLQVSRPDQVEALHEQHENGEKDGKAVENQGQSDGIHPDEFHIEEL